MDPVARIRDSLRRRLLSSFAWRHAPPSCNLFPTALQLARGEQALAAFENALSSQANWDDWRAKVHGWWKYAMKSHQPFRTIPCA
jgi:hypothetical protein